MSIFLSSHLLDSIFYFIQLYQDWTGTLLKNRVSTVAKIMDCLSGPTENISHIHLLLLLLKIWCLRQHPWLMSSVVFVFAETCEL